MIRRLFHLLPFILSVLTFIPASFGQTIMPNRVVPSAHYFEISMPEFYNGDFQKALGDFNFDLRNAVKIPDANGQMFPWLDSLCYWIMCGECHYQMARYDEAMTAFNTALQIYLNQPDWLKMITYSNGPVAIPRPPLPWGASTRKGGLGNFKNCGFQMLQENVQVIPLGQRGVALANQQQLTSIHANEIITRLALMIRRRAEILGPLSKYDPKTKDLVQILGGRPCPPNHFSGVWIDVLHGLALSAMGDDTAAATSLDKGLLMQGLFDHQLTPFALDELGNIALRAGKTEDAIKLYFEASLCSTWFGEWALLGETFRNMANAQKVFDKTKSLPPLQAALTYIQGLRNPSPLVLVPLCHELAEDALTAGNVKLALDLCNQASGAMSRRAISDTMHGARNVYLRAALTYVQAFIDYTNGRPLSLQAGDKNLETALTFLRRGSLWLYQLGLLENFFQAGAITTRGPITIRIADELYEYLLRDPSSIDWALRPMDCLALMTFTPPSAYERWFFVAYQRGDREKAFEVSERARRAKFYSSFPLGPRLFSLRILFEGTGEEVDQQMLLERQTLALDFTRFGQLSDKVRDVRKQLQMLPIVPKDPIQLDKQKSLLAELDKLSQAQEAMLRPIALTRTKAPNVFPPIMKLDRIRNELPEKTGILLFTESLGTIYGFLIDKRKMDMWPIVQEPRAPSLQKLIVDYLEAIGNRDANRAIPLKDLADPNAKWKTAGAELLKRLLGEQRQAGFTELVIVPTGPLWYVPFESMTVKIGEEYRPLISAGEAPLSIRYAPMASLGVPKKASRSVVAETLVLYGKMVNRDAPTVALDAIDRYTKQGIKNLVPMPAIPNDPDYRELPGSASAFATQVKQLVVLDDIPASRNGGPLDWSPFTADRARQNNPISSWFVLPWGGPQLLVLPGFHTPAESALKTVGSGPKTVPNGDDLFLSAMALEACGAKTILISRWKTGGRAAFDLVGEFLENDATMPAAEAWRQAIIDVGGEALILDEEPRVRSAPGDEATLANHPFFWGAFLLIDRGERPEAPDAAAPGEKSKLD